MKSAIQVIMGDYRITCNAIKQKAVEKWTLTVILFPISNPTKYIKALSTEMSLKFFTGVREACFEGIFIILRKCNAESFPVTFVDFWLLAQFSFHIKYLAGFVNFRKISILIDFISTGIYLQIMSPPRAAGV